MVRYIGDNYQETTVSPSVLVATARSFSTFGFAIAENTGTVRSVSGVYSSDVLYKLEDQAYYNLSERYKGRSYFAFLKKNSIFS
jgi:hypothetical protein